MGSFPPQESLDGTPPGVLYGLLARGAETALTATYEHAWQKDRALVGVIDTALHEAARGGCTGQAAKPRWLDGLLARELRRASSRYSRDDRFVRVRLLERLGLVSFEPDDTYVLAMVGALGPGKAARLRADRDLVERVLWRVFEVEGGAPVSLTNVDRFGGGQWRAAFLELTGDGTLDRGRVLTSCLQALGRDFAAYRAGWYSATYLAMEPTIAETAASQDLLRRLLSARVPATVAFALGQLARLERAGVLEVAPTLAALPPATAHKARSTALAALGLARRAARQFPAAAGNLARAALGHRHPDVQRAAAALLAGLGEDRAIRAAAADLTPGVRADLGLRASVVQPDDAPAVQSLPQAPVPVTGADLAERAAALLEDASDAGEMEAVMAALVTPEAGERLAPLRKRAAAVVARGPLTEAGDAWLPGQVARLVLDAAGERVAPADLGHPAQRFVTRRMAEIRSSPAPLLATPDLPGGWLSPAAFTRRLADNPVPRHHDFIAALLRLHPDGREAAAREAGDLPAAARVALGGATPPRRSGRAEPAAWLAAAQRSLAPYSPAEAPRLRDGISTHSWQEGGSERQFRYVTFAVMTANAAVRADDHPADLHDDDCDPRSRHPGSDLGDWVPALAAIWPGDAEHFLALTCLPILESPASTEIARDVPRTLDALARHPGRLGTLAAATLAACISAAQRDYRLHGIDAFLDLAASGRIPVREVAAPMARYAQAWPASRWAQSLAAVAGAPGGARAAVDLLTALLPLLPARHRGLAALLDLLRDEVIRHGWRVADPALTSWLAGLPGGSAAAATARMLLTYR